MTQITEYQPTLGFPMNPKRKNEYNSDSIGHKTLKDSKSRGCDKCK